MGLLRIICALVLLFSGIVFASYSDYVNMLRESSRGEPSYGVGEKLSNQNQDLKYPEEVTTVYFENDLLSPKKYTKNWKWPNGKVYYKFGKGLDGSTDEKSFIIEAIDFIESRTSAVKFTRRTDQDDYIYFDNKKTGCWSALGRVGGKQVINLQYPECYAHDHRTVQHMLFHALGLAHENNRYDRNDHISVQKGNIIQTFEKYFKRHKDHKFRTPYDLMSIMHFTSKTNSDNGFDVFTSKNSSVLTSDIGWVGIVQPSDIQRLEEIY